MAEIKLTSRFSVDFDKYNTILIERVAGKDIEGNAKTQIRTTYHGNLHQACMCILEKEGNDCKTAMSVIKCWKEVSSELKKSIKMNRRALFGSIPDEPTEEVENHDAENAESATEESAENEENTQRDALPERRRRSRVRT